MGLRRSTHFLIYVCFALSITFFASTSRLSELSHHRVRSLLVSHGPISLLLEMPQRFARRHSRSDLRTFKSVSKSRTLLVSIETSDLALPSRATSCLRWFLYDIVKIPITEVRRRDPHKSGDALFLPWHRLWVLPLLQGQGAPRPILFLCALDTRCRFARDLAGRSTGLS